MNENEMKFQTDKVIITPTSHGIGIVPPHGERGFCVGETDHEGYIVLDAEASRQLIKILQEYLVCFDNSRLN